MAGVFVISTSQDINGAGVGGTTTAIDTSTADILIFGGASYGPGSGETLSDFLSNMWSGLTQQTDTFNITGRQYYAKNAIVGGSETFTFTGTGIYPSCCVMALSGSDLSDPFDQENGATTNGTSLATGSVTPSTDNQILIAFLAFDTAGTISVDGGFTGLIQTNASGSNEGSAMAYLIQTTATAANPTFTSSGSSGHMAATIATFKTATSPPPPAGGGTILQSSIIG